MVVDPDTGAIRRSLSGAVPASFPQTPQAAEFYVLKAVAPLLDTGVQIASDCSNVIKQMTAQLGEQLHKRRPYAGISRAVAQWPIAAECMQRMRKVPAHVSVDVCASEEARRDARGNNAADQVAKSALSRHPAPSPVASISMVQQWQDALATARLIAAAGPLWPAVQPPGGRRQRLQKVAKEGCANLPAPALKARAARARAATHSWADFRGVSRCSKCWAVKSKLGVATKADCPGRSALHADVIEAAPRLGHDLWAAEVCRPRCAPSCVLVCMRCGAYVETGGNPDLQVWECTPPSKHGLAQIARVRRRLHPRAGPTGKGAVLDGLARVDM